MISRKIVDTVRKRANGKWQLSTVWPFLPARNGLKEMLQATKETEDKRVAYVDMAA
jgi:hypothetical protein